MAQTHKCGPCDGAFASREEFLAHGCTKAEGAKPTSPDYLVKTTTPNFAKISEAAVKRGADKAKK